MAHATLDVREKVPGKSIILSDSCERKPTIRRWIEVSIVRLVQQPERMALSVELTLALTVLIDQRRTRLGAEEQVEDQQEEEERTAVIHRSSTPRGFLRIGLFPQVGTVSIASKGQNGKKYKVFKYRENREAPRARIVMNDEGGSWSSIDSSG
jgi:hypothetical protein